MLVSLVLDLGLEHSCPWPRECLSSKRLSLASDFFCVLGLEPCVLDSTSGFYNLEILDHFFGFTLKSNRFLVRFVTNRFYNWKLEKMLVTALCCV